MKLTPASRAFATIRVDVASSVGPPNIMVPRQIGEIFRPLRPRLRYCMGYVLTMLAPSPRTSRGRDERSSLLEGWGEGLSPRALQHTMCGDSPSPGFARARESDLSPQAGRGEENARRRLHRSSLRAQRSNPCHHAKKEWIASSLSLL